MAETAKRTECVKVCFEERLFLDLNRIAIREERRLADLCYMVLRRYAYGNANGAQPPDQNTEKASESP